MSTEIDLPLPNLQTEFAFALAQMRNRLLQDALFHTVNMIDIAVLDQDLARYVKAADLKTLARVGLRGELAFATPCLLEANPYLLGYYRLLLGYSQKSFYGRDEGFNLGRFKSMETRGVIAGQVRPELPALCGALCSGASHLLSGLKPLVISRDLLDDLTVLTIGPQLRGGANNQGGSKGIILVFEVIREIVAHAAVAVKDRLIEVQSSTERPFLIAFAADPDIIIREQMDGCHHRNAVAIEIKGGRDISNVHNRLGEAEKSHQKARQQGFTECWTVHNVTRLDAATARAESPSTNRFYSLAGLASRTGSEYEDFRRRIISLTAISSPDTGQ